MDQQGLIMTRSGPRYANMCSHSSAFQLLAGLFPWHRVSRSTPSRTSFVIDLGFLSVRTGLLGADREGGRGGTSVNGAMVVVSLVLVAGGDDPRETLVMIFGSERRRRMPFASGWAWQGVQSAGLIVWLYSARASTSSGLAGAESPGSGLRLRRRRRVSTGRFGQALKSNSRSDDQVSESPRE